MSANDPSAQQEKEALKKEIGERIEREFIKKEILSELKPAEPKFFRFLKHPLTLLIWGFTLTTIVGSWLTSNWQRQEWNRQQSYLAQQRKLEQKYSITEDVTKAIAETNSAADDILAMFFWDVGNKRRGIESSERRKYWQQTSRAWRINTNVLQPKLTAHFKNPQVEAIFDDIAVARIRIGNNITNLLVDLDANPKGALANPEIKKEVEATLELVNKTRKLLKQLAETMVQEIQEDGIPQPMVAK